MTSGTGDRAVGYAGDVDAAAAFEALRKSPAAQLVDVRSDAEWSFVGVPDLAPLGKEPLLVSWQTFPGMRPNEDFVHAVTARVPATDTPLYFLCRSGARSRAAAIAMTAAGYGQAFNVAGGFEGDLDDARHRGRKGGWKAAGLPWKQS